MDMAPARVAPGQTATDRRNAGAEDLGGSHSGVSKLKQAAMAGCLLATSPALHAEVPSVNDAIARDQFGSVPLSYPRAAPGFRSFERSHAGSRQCVATRQ
jgi:hypothetical protein